MRYYELVIIMNTLKDNNSDRLICSLKEFINNNGGVVHRYEKWGTRRLAYRIKNLQEAYYILMYIECDNKTLLYLKKEIKYNSLIIRHLILRIKEIGTNSSPLSISNA